MENLRERYEELLTWGTTHRGTVWLISAALLVLYVIIETWGQDWTDDEYEDNHFL